MEIGSFTGLGNVIKTARTLLVTLQQNKLSDEHKALVDQALEVVRDVGDRILDLQVAQSALKEENAALQTALAEAKKKNDRHSNYKLIETPAGAFVLESIVGSPKHYVCPTCLESKDEIHALHPHGMLRGSRLCRACKAVYAFNKGQTPPEDSGGDDSWISTRR